MSDVKINFAPTTEEIAIHYRKLMEFTLKQRPDLAPFSQTRYCTLEIHDDEGKLVGGAYMYSSLGTAVLESVWTEPGRRGLVNLHLFAKELVRICRLWKSNQMVGYSADFLGTADVLVKYFNVELFATLEDPDKRFSLNYFRFKIEP